MTPNHITQKNIACNLCMCFLLFPLCVCMHVRVCVFVCVYLRLDSMHSLDSPLVV